MATNRFNTGAPIAYFLTWTTYGTWLPGDERGWNRKDDLKHQPGNQVRHESAITEMKESPFLLCDHDRKVVEETIVSHCSIREWKLHAVNIRTNHVHVVVTASNYEPKTVASQFKAWSTRVLKQEHTDRERFWTQGASCRWINQEDELANVIEYTLEAQDRKGVE